jgi:hypothetical protein
MKRADRQVSLPVALLIVGVALSCSTACVTSAVIDAAAASKRVAADAANRSTIEQELRVALPPASAGASSEDRLRVDGGGDYFSVAAKGNFSTENVSVFIDAVRQLPAHGIPFRARVDVVVNGDADSPSVLKGKYEIDHIRELNAELRSHLPPSVGKLRDEDRLSVTGEPELFVAATADFTPERARDYLDFIRGLPARFPGLPRLHVTLWRDLPDSGRRELVERFDLPKSAHP